LFHPRGLTGDRKLHAAWETPSGARSLASRDRFEGSVPFPSTCL
jgi:hypothetical protein